MSLTLLSSLHKSITYSYFQGDDDPKVVKALADLQQAETLYRDLNRELVDTLPATYDSRITFFVDTLQTIFNVESTNHTECGKVCFSKIKAIEKIVQWHMLFYGFSSLLFSSSLFIICH